MIIAYKIVILFDITANNYITEYNKIRKNIMNICDRNQLIASPETYPNNTIMVYSFKWIPIAIIYL